MSAMQRVPFQDKHQAPIYFVLLKEGVYLPNLAILQLASTCKCTSSSSNFQVFQHTELAYNSHGTVCVCVGGEECPLPFGELLLKPPA